ncbi:hypothetical protein FMUAM8_49530 [Nocardia cyriacigeorgica]|nr:hypothetical protein FMUAM8_49530 [Nocardia cyriacigeorgica]BDU08590.1 hypothetical protein FMUBM48_48530 [Nocardia cyriacigeorgica]
MHHGGALLRIEALEQSLGLLGLPLLLVGATLGGLAATLLLLGGETLLLGP